MADGTLGGTSTDTAAILEARVLADTGYWIDRARAITGADARRLTVPEVRFDLRGQVAGQAVFMRRSRACRIRINAQLLATHPQEMLAETVPHEVAHVVVYCLHGSKARPHGDEWKALMRAFGLVPTPCHTLPAEPVRRLKRFRYACNCDDVSWLTSIRHKRVARGTVYLCRRCGEHLHYAPETDVQPAVPDS